MKQIIVNVSGLSEEEKQRVNEALAKITGARKMLVITPSAAWLFAPASSGAMRVTWDYLSSHETPTHTPQQVLEMAGMVEKRKVRADFDPTKEYSVDVSNCTEEEKKEVLQGHVHAENMALYAEDAKTTDKPWEGWQIKTASSEWRDLTCNPSFGPHLEYRRKPKTHTVNGVEIPDLRFEPKNGEWYHVPDPLITQLYLIANPTSQAHSHRKDNNLCYENTEEGKQAAVLHAKAWLGIA